MPEDVCLFFFWPGFGKLPSDGRLFQARRAS